MQHVHLLSTLLTLLLSFLTSSPTTPSPTPPPPPLSTPLLHLPPLPPPLNSRGSFLLSPSTLRQLRQSVLLLLSDAQPEVREMAALMLTGLLQSHATWLLPDAPSHSNVVTTDSHDDVSMSSKEEDDWAAATRQLLMSAAAAHNRSSSSRGAKRGKRGADK